MFSIIKKIVSVVILTMLFVAVYPQKQVINDANAEARNVKGFHVIKVSHAIDLYLTQDEKEAVVVSASKPEYRDRIKTTVENGVLKIWYDEEHNWWRNNGNKKLKAYVSFSTLDKLVASGASDVIVSGGIKANDLVMDFSGASDFTGEINANSLDMDLSGASDATVKGKVVNLKVDASGASEFKGYDLFTDNCSAEASGASDIRITVKNELNVHASGASGIYYKGEGRIRDLRTSGASSVSRKS